MFTLNEETQEKLNEHHRKAAEEQLKKQLTGGAYPSLTADLSAPNPEDYLEKLEYLDRLINGDKKSRSERVGEFIGEHLFSLLLFTIVTVMAAAFIQYLLLNLNYNITIGEIVSALLVMRVLKVYLFN